MDKTTVPTVDVSTVAVDARQQVNVVADIECDGPNVAHPFLPTRKLQELRMESNDASIVPPVVVPPDPTTNLEGSDGDVNGSTVNGDVAPVAVSMDTRVLRTGSDGDCNRSLSQSSFVPVDLSAHFPGSNEDKDDASWMDRLHVTNNRAITIATDVADDDCEYADDSTEALIDSSDPLNGGAVSFVLDDEIIVTFDDGTTSAPLFVLDVTEENRLHVQSKSQRRR